MIDNVELQINHASEASFHLRKKETIQFVNLPFHTKNYISTSSS